MSNATQGQSLVLYTDGAARGNPGPAGAGVYIVDERGAPVAERQRYLGRTTNNVAEYNALLLALQIARELRAARVEVRSDSELLVRQMRGEYRIRNAALRELAHRARSMESEFDSVAYVHIRREQNREADRLANRAIDVQESI